MEPRLPGFSMASATKKKGVPLVTLFYSPSHFLGSNENALIEEIRGQGVEILEVAKPVFEKLSYRDRPDGLLAIATQTHSQEVVI